MVLMPLSQSRHSEEQRSLLRDHIEEFEDVIAWEEKDVTRTYIPAPKIDTGDAQPLKQKFIQSSSNCFWNPAGRQARIREHANEHSEIHHNQSYARSANCSQCFPD